MMRTENTIAPIKPAFYDLNALPKLLKNHHQVSAIYAQQADAEAVRKRLLNVGFQLSAVEILTDPAHVVIEEGSDHVLKEILVDGAIGTAIGTGVGVAGTVMLWASSVTLFVASPLLSPLVMMGWFGSIGALLGAANGAMENSSTPVETKFSSLVLETIQAGQVMLIVHTYYEKETILAKRILSSSLVQVSPNTSADLTPDDAPLT